MFTTFTAVRRAGFFGLLLFTTCFLGAQTDAAPRYQNEVGIAIGLHSGFFRDRNFFPLNYSNSGWDVRLHYGRITRGGNRYHVGFGLASAGLTSAVRDETAPARYLVDLTAGWQKRFDLPDAGATVYAGLNYRSSLDITFYDGTEAVTFFALHGLEAAGEAIWRYRDRHSFRVNASIPFVGLLSRPPYTGWDKFIVDNSDNIPKVITRGRWTSFNDFFVARAGLAYGYALNDRWSMEARYRLAYRSTRLLDPVRSLDNVFSLSTTRKF